VLLLALALAGCAGPADGDDGIATAAGGKASPSASASPAEKLTDDERRLKFAECMRGQGIEMEDPGTDRGGVRFRVGEGNKPGDMEAAMQKCKAYAPNGGEPPKLNAEQLKQMRAFAKCMRENGIPDFPDPDASGRLTFQRRAGKGLRDDAFKEAQEKCRELQPRLRQESPK
jgi:hypothetical protein